MLHRFQTVAEEDDIATGPAQENTQDMHSKDNPGGMRHEWSKCSVAFKDKAVLCYGCSSIGFCEECGAFCAECTELKPGKGGTNDNTTKRWPLQRLSAERGWWQENKPVNAFCRERLW